VRRLIQIKDGHPETVQIWLAFLRKHAYYGIGMKANVWEYNKLGMFDALKSVVIRLTICYRCGQGYGCEHGGDEGVHGTTLGVVWTETRCADCGEGGGDFE
jgi:hypothetical protein